MKYRMPAACLAVVLALAACATTTSPTGRTQYMAYSDSELNQMGAQAFTEMKTKQKTLAGGQQSAYVQCVVNALVKPVLVILTLPITVLTLGLFLLVINALLFWAVASLVPGFSVTGFWSALIGALLYSVIAWALSAILPDKH